MQRRSLQVQYLINDLFVCQCPPPDQAVRLVLEYDASTFSSVRPGDTFTISMTLPTNPQIVSNEWRWAERAWNMLYKYRIETPITHCIDQLRMEQSGGEIDVAALAAHVYNTVGMPYQLKHATVECAFAVPAFAERVRTFYQTAGIDPYAGAVGGIYIIAPGNDRTILGNSIKCKIGRADNFEERATEYYYNTWVNHRALGLMIPIAKMQPTKADKTAHAKSLQAEAFFQLLFWESLENKHVGDVGGRSTRGLRKPKKLQMELDADAAAAPASGSAVATMEDDDPIEVTPSAKPTSAVAAAAAAAAAAGSRNYKRPRVSLNDAYPMGLPKSTPVRVSAPIPISAGAGSGAAHVSQPQMGHPTEPAKKRRMNLSAALQMVDNKTAEQAACAAAAAAGAAAAAAAAEQPPQESQVFE